jgi:hypothetical protein
MFCPQCNAEYRPGFTRCIDCDTELVDHLVADVIDAEAARSSGYAPVATVQGQLEADQICSFLGANGIDAVVEGEPFRNLHGIRIGGIAALRIMVPPELAVAARDLLTKADRGELTIDAADGETTTS